METDLSKYYQPDISEFYVGFEYEYKLGAYDKGLKTKDEFDSKDWEKDVFDGQHFSYLDRALNGLNADSGLCHIRVKYLDRDCIESLDWVLPKVTDLTSDNLIFLNRYDDYDLIFKKSKNFVIIRRKKMHVIFQGTIKNKSELKKLLKQLGI